MLEQRRGEDECLNRWRGELAMRDGEARRGVRTLALIPLSEGRHSRQTSIFVQNSRTGEASECLGEARPEANTGSRGKPHKREGEARTETGDRF